MMHWSFSAPLIRLLRNDILGVAMTWSRETDISCLVTLLGFQTASGLAYHFLVEVHRKEILIRNGPQMEYKARIQGAHTLDRMRTES